MRARESCAPRVSSHYGKSDMLWAHFAGMTAALVTIVLATPTQAQQPAPPPFATTKVADNVYIFRYGGHQSMFIVTPDGVIATDPSGDRRSLISTRSRP